MSPPGFRGVGGTLRKAPTWQEDKEGYSIEHCPLVRRRKRRHVLDPAQLGQLSLLRKACSAEFLPEAAGRARVSGRDVAFAGWQ